MSALIPAETTAPVSFTDEPAASEEAAKQTARVDELFKAFCHIVGRAVRVQKHSVGNVAARITRTAHESVVFAQVPLVPFDGMVIDFNTLITETRATAAAERCSFRGMEIRISPDGDSDALRTDLHAIVSTRPYEDQKTAPAKVRRPAVVQPVKSTSRKRGIDEAAAAEDVSDLHTAFARVLKVQTWCGDVSENTITHLTTASNALYGIGFSPDDDEVWEVALDRTTVGVMIMLALCRSVQVVLPASGAPTDKTQAAAQLAVDDTADADEDDVGGERVIADFSIRVPPHHETKADYPPVIALVSQPVAPPQLEGGQWSVIVPLDCTEQLYSPIPGVTVVFSLSKRQWFCFIATTKDGTCDDLRFL